MITSFLVGTVTVPLIAALFKNEIANFYKALTVFSTRPFDEDRDPNTPDSCQLYNAASGEWQDILIERYAFSLNKNKRGVFVYHPIDGKLAPKKDWAAERIPLIQWADMRKRTIPQPLAAQLEEDLSRNLARNTSG